MENKELENSNSLNSNPQNKKTIDELMQEVADKVMMHQNFYYGFIGGLLAAVVSALLWAVITVTVKFQTGFMAIGVGLLVGFSVRFFGAGIDKKFGIMSALLALFGCLLGNLFSQVAFVAQHESLGFLEVFSYLNLSDIVDIMKESFHPMDILFYGFAIYEGYRFSFRKLNEEQIVAIAAGTHSGIPAYDKLKLPLIIIIIILLFAFVFKVRQGVV